MLYHVKRTPCTLIPNTASVETTFLIDGIYTDLESAKAAAFRLLFTEGYQPDHLLEVHLQQKGAPWHYGNGVFLFARTPHGGIMTVEVESTRNIWELLPHSGSQIDEPLFFLIQTTVEPTKVFSPDSQSTVIRGVFKNKDDAIQKAREFLLQGEDPAVVREDCLVYQDDLDHTKGHYGEDVVVHVVDRDGSDIFMQVVQGSSIGTTL